MEIRSTKGFMEQFSHIAFGVRPNKPLVPTRNGEGPLLAAQRPR